MLSSNIHHYTIQLDESDRVAKHDVYIDGLSSDTTEDDVHAHLTDSHVNQIISIFKVNSDVIGTSAVRVTIADDTIKHDVYNSKKTFTPISVSSLSDVRRAQRTSSETTKQCT